MGPSGTAPHFESFETVVGNPTLRIIPVKTEAVDAVCLYRTAIDPTVFAVIDIELVLI